SGNGEHMQEITLMPPSGPPGQTVVSIASVCSTVPSLWCRRSDQTRYISNIIIVDHTLSEGELTLKASLNTSLQEASHRQASLTARTRGVTMKAEAYLSVVAPLNTDLAKAAEDTQAINDALDQSLAGFGSARASYLAQDYTTLDKKMVALTLALDDVEARIHASEGLISAFEGDYMAITELLGSLDIAATELRDATALYTATEDENTLLVIQDYSRSYAALREPFVTKNVRDNGEYLSRVESLQRIITLLVHEYEGVVRTEYLKTSFATDVMRLSRDGHVTWNATQPKSAPGLDDVRRACAAHGKVLNDVASLENASRTWLVANRPDLVGDATFIRSLRNARKAALAHAENTTINEYLNLSESAMSWLSLISAASENLSEFGIDENDSSMLISPLPPTISDEIRSMCDALRRPADMNITTIPSLPAVEHPAEDEPGPLPEPIDQCCALGICQACCDDCDLGPYPVIFVHGHSFLANTSPETSMDSFSEIQLELQTRGYIDGGSINYGSGSTPLQAGAWSRQPLPITVRASYYYTLISGDDSIEWVVRNTDGIENYALRLKDIIDIVKARTGKPRVNLVAHSMGGLVARSYIDLFGGDDVSTLTLIATPNAGVEGRTRSLCPVFGSKRECEDLSAGSVFLQRLNSKNASTIVTHTITATGCAMSGGEGDGIVLTSDAVLAGATDHRIQGHCTDRLGSDLHNTILDPMQYPQVVDIIDDILGAKQS
ncbi:MAG: alpha/beta fold hydrolase, partial [Nanoarchaeota archaeon]